MKHKTLFLILLLAGTTLNAQYYTLFVNDNKVNTANTNAVLSNLSAMGIIYDVFNAADSLRSPTLTEMEPYSIIIWYCSSDGVALQLWNGNDTDNADLKAWIEMPGKGIWLIGTDILYDRWVAPTIFSEGDFMYDYLGLQEYHAQSYGDDGGLGVAQLDNVEGSFAQTFITPIQWQFPTAWWVDACIPNAEAFPLYSLGPQGYVFDTYYAAIAKWNGTMPGNVQFTYFFDPALMDSDENMQILLAEAFWIITQIVTSVEEPKHSEAIVSVSPNPATNNLKIVLRENESIKQLTVFNTNGLRVLQMNSVNPEINLTGLDSGLYLLVVTTEKGDHKTRFIKQ
ncbi:MAG: T9SS type A sorting domain-containing protein [Bacteroidales bacterium]|nr:T9SS type A sorting domain-containing protein [Bacteroidales bacterium]MDD3663714.1 T9SS type A sorting domain-containing protein [Bacteroidales bacterium]